MSRWLDMFRQAAVQIDTPVQLGQKGAVRSDNHLSAPNRPICTGMYPGKRPRRAALSPVPLTEIYPVQAGDEWLADPWYALRCRVKEPTP